MKTAILDGVEFLVTDEVLEEMQGLIPAIPELKVGDVVLFDNGSGNLAEHRLVVPFQVGKEGPGLVTVNADGHRCQDSLFIRLQRSGAYRLLYNVFEKGETD